MLITSRSDATTETRPSPSTNPPEKYVPDLVYTTTRSLMRVASSDEAISLLSGLVRKLGGNIVPASADDPNALQIDISLGHGEPVYPVAERGSAAHWLLSTYLPNVVKDAQAAFEMALRAEVLAKDAGIDAVSGLPNHRTLSRLVTRLQTGDAIVAVDLDWIHVLGTDDVQSDQEILRAFARDLRNATRATEFCGRSSGGEFVALLNDPGPDGAFKLLERLQTRWAKRPSTMPHTFSGGIAKVDDRGWRPAIQAADRALRRCQETGDHWESALPDDYAA
jgi:GGDEF domain-containing protein